MRPYKGIDVLLEAWRGHRVARSCGSWACRAWTSRAAARRRLRRACASCRASSATTELAALMRRAEPRRAALPRDRPVGRRVHRAGRGRAAAAERRRRLPRDRGDRRRAHVPRGRRRRAARGAAGAARRSGRRCSAMAERARAAAERPVLRGRRSRAARSSCTRRSWTRDSPPMIALEIVFWVCAGLIVWTQVGYAARSRVLARVLRRPRPSLAPPSQPERSPKPSLPSLSLIVAAHDEESVIGAKVANALALDYPRERLELIVACDGCSDATAARAREAGADLVLELPARRQDPRAGRRRRARARRDRRVLRRQRAVGARTRRARSWRLRRPARRLRLRAGPLRAGRRRRSGRHQPGGRLLALRAGRARARVAPVLDHRRQRRDLRDAPRHLHRRRPDHGPRPLAARSTWSSAACARSTSRTRARARRWSPRSAGEFARKRRMMSHTWPILLRGGMLSPRGYPPGYALMILSHRAAALLHARSCTCSRSRPTSRSWRCGAGAALHRHARAAARAAGAAAASAARCPSARC